MDALTRSLRLLSLLQARPWWTGGELAERLGVTPRTIRRDVRRLRELGYPVDADPGRLGGYQLRAGSAMPPLLLEDDEAVAIAVGMRAAAERGVGGLGDAAVAALVKLEHVLPERLRRRVSALGASTVTLDRPPSEVAADAEVLLVLGQGCRNRERLRFRYQTYDGTVSRRDVEPYRLVHTGTVWYLVARDLRRDDWRTFRVDRVSEPLLTGVRAHPGAAPDAAALVAEGIAVRPYRWQARVLLDLPVTEAAHRVAPNAGLIEPDDRGTILRIGADDLDWLARYLVRLNCRFDILEPPELRTAVRDLARWLLREFRPS